MIRKPSDPLRPNPAASREGRKGGRSLCFLPNHQEHWSEKLRPTRPPTLPGTARSPHIAQGAQD